MPYNFCELEPYRVDYCDLLCTLEKLPQFLSSPDYQAHFIQDWIKELQKLDAIVCKQMVQPNSLLRLYGEIQSEPEIFGQAITIGNNSFYIQFRITALLNCIANNDRPLNPVSVPKTDFDDGDILRSDRPDCEQVSLEYPIILVQFPFLQYHWLVIDGNHRLSKHIKHGSTNIPCYVLGGDVLINNLLFVAGFDQHLYALLCELNAAKHLHERGVSDKEILKKSIIYSEDRCFHFSAEDI